MSFIKYTEQAMRDVDRGKRMIEEMVLEQLLDFVADHHGQNRDR